MQFLSLGSQISTYTRALFPQSFAQFATQQNYLYFFSPMFALLLVPGPLTFKAMCNFNHFYVVKENASYALFYWSFRLSFIVLLRITCIPDPGKFSSGLSENLVT